MADSGIITMEEYGNVRLKLKERMDSDGINRTRWQEESVCALRSSTSGIAVTLKNLTLTFWPASAACCTVPSAICWNITADITAASAAMSPWQAAAKLIKSEVDGD